MIFRIQKVGYVILGGGFKHFLFSPLPGEMIQFDEHIFQMGGFNHQLVLVHLEGNIFAPETLGPPEKRLIIFRVQPVVFGGV